MHSVNPTTPKISIVIPTYTNSKGLFECLQVLSEDSSSIADISTIVVANGAPPEVKNVYLQYPNTELIWVEEACGYTNATNIGIRSAMEQGAEFIVLMNDDFLPGKPKDEWLGMLLAPFFEDEKMGITGPVINHCPAAQRNFLIFFCVMVRTAMLEEVGILDEVFNPGSGEDTDLCCRAIDSGWKIRQVPTEEPTTLVDKGCENLPEWKRMKMHTSFFPGYHDGNATFSKMPEMYDAVMKRNHEILTHRYAPVNIERAKTVEGWFAEDEMEWIGRQVKSLPAGAVVVEVGSWKGRSSRAIADNLPEGGKLYCVDTFCGSSGEPDAHATAKQREGDNVFMSFFHALHDHIDAGRVVPVRMTSEHAAETLNNLRPDLIFLDGDHSAEGIKTDVEAWLPLLKEGGLLCGHDYYKEDEGPWWVYVREYVETRFPDVQKSATSIWHVRPNEKVKRGKVVDAFIFCNELDQLDIRLAELDEVVDVFVLVEGTRYHNNTPKELFFENSRERYAKYLHKIRHVVVDDWPENPTDAWVYERHQRDAIMHGLTDCKDNDIIIIGDADEIPSAEAVRNYSVSQGLCRLKQRMFYYYLNCENKEGWDWQKIAPYRIVKQLTPCGVRYPPSNAPLIESAGWHFSMMGGSEAVKQKLRTYSHQEFARPEIFDGVESAIENGTDLFGRDLKYEFVYLDPTYPSYVKDNLLDLEKKGLWRERVDAPLTTLTSLIEKRGGMRFPDIVADPAVRQDIAENKGMVISTGTDRHSKPTITACVSTKDRYFTTLPMCLSAIANQTRKPEKLKIYDDGEQLDLRELPPYDGILHMLDEVGIDWEIIKTPRLGQVTNHQHCLDFADTEFVWRCDDDELPEPDCLKTLLNTFRDYGNGGEAESIGAVAGLVHHPGNVGPLPENVDGTLKDVQLGLNLQWFDWSGYPREVEHLYSTFLYRVEAGRKAGGYPRELSQVGHREETIFSHSIHRAGFKLLVNPRAKTWHLRQSTGGIRSFTDHSMWEHDEQVFQDYLRAWKVDSNETKLIYCDMGLGDHLLLKGVFPQIQKAHAGKRLTLALCYPQVFEDVENVDIISIADAKLIIGDRHEDFLLYSWCWKNNKQQPLSDSMVEFWSK